MPAVTLAHLIALFASGDLIVDSQKPGHPFQHLIHIPSHELSFTGEVHTSYLRFDSVANGDSPSAKNGWNSEFDAAMSFAEFGMTFPVADNLYLGIAVEGGDIVEDSVSLSKGKTVYLSPDENLGSSLSTAAFSLKSRVLEGAESSVSLKTSAVLPAGGAFNFLSLGSVTFTQSVLATAEIFDAQYLTVNAGCSIPTGGYDFEERLRPALVKFFSASYLARWGDFSMAAIYEASTPLFRRPDTMDALFSSIALSAQIGTKTGRYFLVVARGIGGESFDYSVSFGRGWRL